MKKIYAIILIAAILSSFRLLVPLIRQSATFDEPFKIASAYLLAKDDSFDYGSWDPQVIFNPPLFGYMVSLPLRFLKPDVPRPSAQMEMNGRPGYFANVFAFGYRFLHDNRVPAGKMLVTTRAGSLALYIVSGIALYFLIKTLFGLQPALIFVKLQALLTH
jgi:hypothetical protein